ncbi:MAG: hypothetical protein AUH85_14195 [Chloroflexi bacterium 13_1_40CM_4_68_4]|nr:MAG: hypothetical protein AUH85_14195 [Chloroflexi bacterium 13_1_40CM_4_68_4]
MTVAPFALERWFRAAAAAGTVDLSSSGVPPVTLAELLQLTSHAERESFTDVSLGYGPPDGDPALRAAVAARYRGVAASDVLLTCGAIEALHLAVVSLVKAGDEVIVQDPMYPAVAGLARLVGAHVVLWRLEEECGFGAALDALMRLLTARTRLVAITQPNGPTGSILNTAELDALIATLDGRGVRLLSDEVYRDLVLEPGLRVPSAAERAPHAIVVGDVAKPFGLGGLRIGWIVTADAGLRERLACLRDYTTLSVATMSAVLARIALAHASELLAEPLEDARTNLTTLAATASSHAFSFVAPRAGVTVFLRVPDASRVQRELQREGVLVVPGELFGHPDRLRIGLATKTSQFAHALARLNSLVFSRERSPEADCAAPSDRCEANDACPPRSFVVPIDRDSVVIDAGVARKDSHERSEKLRI